MPAETPLPLALTMGEPAGIGGEIALQAWMRRAEGVPPFVLIDDPLRLTGLAQSLGWRVAIQTVASAAEATSAFAKALPILEQKLGAPVVPGQLDARNSASVRLSIERAVALTQAGETAAVVTNPIHKQAMYQAGFPFPGHTEFLGELAGGGVVPVMMLACPELRVVPVTIHTALAKVPRDLRQADIVHCGKVTAQALRIDFGIAAPRIAVAALNPHAGEEGAMGDEERTIIGPAIAALQASGIDAWGPAPADTLFHAKARKAYDAVLCMYHDQALIPIKTIDFDGGVNTTLGLPFVRTSPDHGTALDIAGKGVANPESLIQALRMAAAMAKNRAQFHV